MGIELEPGQVAMRCNLVTVLDGRIASYSAGNISSAESVELMAALQEELGDERCRFYPGVGFRHILTVRHGEDASCHLVHRASRHRRAACRRLAPRGPGAALALDLMERSKAILKRQPVNERRLAQGKAAGHPDLAVLAGHAAGADARLRRTLRAREAALTSPVDLLKGLAVQTGIDFLPSQG